MLASLLGYFFCMMTALTAAMVVLSGLSNIAMFGNERHYPHPPVIGRTRTVMVETQRHSPAGKEEARAKSVAKEASPANNISADVVTAKAEAKKSKHYKSKVVARQHNNYGYGTWLGYAQESRYAPRGPFFQ